MPHRSAGACAALLLTGLVALVTGRATMRPMEAQASPEEHFKYGSVGVEENEGLPYWIWQAFPRLCADKLPGPGGYASLGMVWEAGRELPVGVTKQDFWTGTRVGINCAFCHVTSWRARAADSLTLVAGGPGNTIDPQAYLRFLQACASDARFTPDGVLAVIDGLTKLSTIERLTHRVVLIPAVRKALAKQGEEFAWTETRPRWGPGTVELNPVKFRLLQLPVDETIGTSDMMPLWRLQARDGVALHWDGFGTSLREVVHSSGVANGASRTSIDLDALGRVEAWVRTAAPPRYPFAIDAARAASGQSVYAAHCASCHQAGGGRTGQVIPIDEVGTDRHRLDAWSRRAADAYNGFADGYEWDFKGFRKTNGYVAVPLDGIWLRAPYLHNGSVPHLEDLLEPAPQRTAVFYRGYDVYDPQRVGFVATGPEAERRGFRVDTRVRGSGNQGHSYGTQLSPAEKRALLEYMKTL